MWYNCSKCGGLSTLIDNSNPPIYNNGYQLVGLWRVCFECGYMERVDE